MTQVMAAVALITDSKRFVLIRRADMPGDPWSGNYALPGGHVKQGESAEEAVLREIMEEVSLSFSREDIVSVLPVHSPVSKPDMKVIPYVVSCSPSIDPVPGDEVSEVRFPELYSGVECVNPQNGYPAMDYGGWIVWGLTYRILRSYLHSGIKRKV